jgi:hypothetical protein
MKKLFVFIILAILSLSFVFAYNGNLKVKDENIMGIVGIYEGKWELLPNYGTSYISMIENPEESYLNEYGYSFPVRNPVKEDTFDYLYVYDSIENEFLPLILNGEENEEITNHPDFDLEDFDRYRVLWAFKHKTSEQFTLYDMYLEYSDEAHWPSVEDYTMNKGWNYLTGTFDMIWKPIKEYKGTCVITDFAGWDAHNQKWVVYSLNKDDFVESYATAEDFAIDNILTSFVVKVQSDCQLSFNGNVPEIPSLPN